MRIPGGGEGRWGGFVESTGPRYSRLLASAFLHLAFFVAIIFLARFVRPIHPQAVTYTVVRLNARPTYVPLKLGRSQSYSRAAQIRREQLRRQHLLSRQLRVTIPAAPKYEGSDAILQQEAQRWTSDITKSLNFHHVYLNHVYELAILVSGDLPFISADELPQHFQSYVTVEVTIDAEGLPRHVHTIAGIVTPTIEEKLLSAIRQFRYIPAMRDGLPIPSQRDIVIHIPS